MKREHAVCRLILSVQMAPTLLNEMDTDRFRLLMAEVIEAAPEATKLLERCSDALAGDISKPPAGGVQ